MKNKWNKKKIGCIAVIFGVIVLPLLYSYFYLGAFWDPYSRLETLPIAVVNNDKGATINGEERNIGQEMCDKLQEDASLKFVFTDEQNAISGTEGEDYYAMLVIPENFSEDIASVASTDKHTAEINFSANEKRNYLASQILSRAVLEIEESVRSSVNAEIVEQLTDKLYSVPEEMAQLQDGMNQLSDGATKLSDGATKLADGTTTFNEKFGQYEDGVSALKDGSATLSNGLVTLDSGLTTLLDGANKLTQSTANIDALSTGTKSLAKGAETFNKSLIQYTAGVDALITNVNSTTTFLSNYVTKVNPSIMQDPVFAAFIKQLSESSNAEAIKKLQAANTELKKASEQIAQGAAKLSSGTTNLPQLKEALTQLSAGLTKAKSGSAKLVTGSQTLYSGVNDLSSATTKLGEAANDIADGATTLGEGALDMKEGVDTAKSGVDTSMIDTNEQLKALDGMSEFAEAPVTIVQDNITSVPNYGTAFAPYFLSLSLWVGGLIIFVAIYYDADSKFKILSREANNKIKRSFAYLLIALTQAVILGVVLLTGLGLKVDNIPMYFISCCLVSMVFISIIQFLMVFFKDLGKFLCLLLLILQLTSCGGTFPMETVPDFFNVLYPFMPMTYSVGLFKEVISGIQSDNLLFHGGILFGLLIVFMTLTVVCSSVKSKRESKSSVMNEALSE